MGVYDVALVCMNGHMVNDRMNRSPEFTTPYCKKCGAKTIHNCPNCNAEIKGDYIVEGVAVLRTSVPEPSRFCYNCGQPYPWTKSSIEAFKELAFAMDNLTNEEREKLSSSIDDLVSDTPRTKLATFNVKQITKKLSREAKDVMKEILITVATESVKSQLGI